MEQIQAYWRRRRSLALAKFLAGVLLLVAASFLARGLKFVSHWVGIQWQSTPPSERLQLASSLTYTLLTVLIVIVSGVYAWLTFATLRELVEARRAAKRPFIVASLEGLNRHHFAANTFLKTNVVIQNLSDAPAFNLQGALEIPTEEVPTNQKWSVSKMLNDFVREPATVAGRSALTVEVQFPVGDYPIPEGLIRGFAELTLKFEDIERNLYELTQSFDLLQFTEGRFHWQVSYDCLYLIPLRTRTYIWDHNIGREILPNRKVRVYERSNL